MTACNEVVDRNERLWKFSVCGVLCHTIHCLLYTSSYFLHSPCPCFTGGALNLPAVLAGAVVAFLLLILLLIAGIIVGAVLLKRKAHKKETPSQRRVQHQQNSSITKCGRGTEEQKGKEVHIYDAVSDNALIDGRAVLYQGLDVGTLDYVSEYTELRGGTYQELDLKGREEEHHYQRTHTNRERKGYERSDLL